MDWQIPPITYIKKLVCGGKDPPQQLGGRLQEGVCVVGQPDMVNSRSELDGEILSETKEKRDRRL